MVFYHWRRLPNDWTIIYATHLFLTSYRARQAWRSDRPLSLIPIFFFLLWLSSGTTSLFSFTCFDLLHYAKFPWACWCHGTLSYVFTIPVDIVRNAARRFLIAQTKTWGFHYLQTGVDLEGPESSWKWCLFANLRRNRSSQICSTFIKTAQRHQVGFGSIRFKSKSNRITASDKLVDSRR